jgi:ATP-binding cassette subfamily B protein
LPIFIRLLRYLKPYRAAIAFGFFCLLFDVTAELLPGLVWKYIVDEVIAKKALRLLFGAVGVLLLLQATDAFFSATRTRVLESVGQRFVFDLRNDLYQKLMRLPLGYFSEARTGDLMSRVGSDVDAVQEVVIRGTDSILANFLRLAGVAVIFCSLSPLLGVATLLPIAIVGFLLRRYNARVKGVYRAAREKLGMVSAKVQDDLSGIRVIKAFARESDESAAFSAVARRYLDENLAAIRLRSLFFPFARWIASFGNTIMIGFGAYLILQGRFTIGGLIAFRSYGRYFFGPIDDLTQINDTAQRAIAAGARIFEVLDAPETVNDAPNARDLPSVDGEIHLDDITFRYRNGGASVFESLQIRIAPGQVAAVVGESGAGKSTLFALIERFYDPETGVVRIDGVDIRTVRQASLRRQVVSVPQETFLFPTTVAENIRYARPDASEAEVESAARSANAHGFIVALPDGYDTKIGERGVKLSGGQRQRLAVARAFLADGRILLLDEATSAVEPESEQIIQEAIERLMRGRTTLIATHRLSTIRNAGVIFVIQHGRLVEQGTHRDLMDRGGQYARMVQQQNGEVAAEAKRARV